jgi:tetratricopeptide (TPR) repeat protein
MGAAKLSRSDVEAMSEGCGSWTGEDGMQRLLLAIAAWVLCALLAGSIVAPGTARAAADDISERLGDCQDDEIDNDDRALICTRIVDDAGLPEDLRSEALVNRGIVYLEEDRLDLAMADFEQAIAFNPTYPAAHAYRGEVHKAKEQFAEAVADYDRAISFFEESADLFANRGEIHRLLGATDKAKADYKAAIRLERTHDIAIAGLKALGGK